MDDEDTPETTTWTSDELAVIDATHELVIAARRRDGTPRKAVPVWVVREGDDVYVRAAYGPATGWHRTALASRSAHIRAGAVERDVTVEAAGDEVNAAVDGAYRSKYRRYEAGIVAGITDERARASTLRLVPRA